MKKIISLILALITFMTPISLFASEDDLLYDECCVSFEDVVYLNQMFEISLFSSDNTLEARFENARQYILKELKNFNNYVDISEYDIPVDLTKALFTSVFLYNPELFYINNSCRYSYSSSTNTIAKFLFDFAYTPSEYAARKKQFDAEVNKITSLVSPNMGEIERALIVHDYLDLHCEYDTQPFTDEEGNTVYRDSSYRADGIIVDKVGVCQSYSMAYYHIMKQLGVDTDFVESTAMNHMWNIFKIDDNWYHVDSTWDDPVPDGYAYVDHKHFLASDELMGSDENKHYDWVANHTCDDTSLDDHFWRNIKGAIALDGEGKAYYHTGLKSSSGNFPYYYFEILSHDLDTHDTQVLKTETKKYWYAWDSNQFYADVYSDVSYYNGKLYYNTPTQIIEMDVDGGNENPIVTYENGDGYIFGSMINDYLLFFGVAKAPKDECDEYFTSLENRIGYTVSDTNTLDVSILRKYLDYSNIPGKIIATLYDENDTVMESKILTLSDCNIEDLNSTATVNFESDEGKYIKLMWWDMNTLSPISINRIHYIN